MRRDRIMRVVYVDSLFLINIIIDYILLLVTAKICGALVPRLRLFAGAVLGAGYAVAAVLPVTDFLAGPLVKVVVGILMVLAAFGGQARPAAADARLFCGGGGLRRCRDGGRRSWGGGMPGEVHLDRQPENPDTGVRRCLCRPGPRLQAGGTAPRRGNRHA